MPGGAYSALSGMQARLQSLDRIAADLANVNTAGYKSERTTHFVAQRDFGAALDAAVDVSAGGTKTNVKPGTITTTDRSLDVAINGQGYFAIQTAAGVRYTRSGNFTRRSDGVLANIDGDPVLDAQNKPIKLGTGVLEIDASGQITAGDSPVGRISVWKIDEDDLVRESGSRFKIAPNVKPQPSDAVLAPKSLEQANVTTIDRMTMMTDVQRSFEALQKGISVLMNDIDSRAISELG
jgi:flagellar basal-body rod protein FlgF